TSHAAITVDTDRPRGGGCESPRPRCPPSPGRRTRSASRTATRATFGANDIVRIDGSITYASDCPKPGINDFFYPATDVYLVPAGTEGQGLTDAGGGRPNTIVSGASLFVDEIIGLTAPGGKLDDGVY